MLVPYVFVWHEIKGRDEDPFSFMRTLWLLKQIENDVFSDVDMLILVDFPSAVFRGGALKDIVTVRV